MESIYHLRKEYKLKSLRKSETSEDPFDQFCKWFSEAVSSGISEPNAMTLATATKEGIPSARIVLLKEYSNNGFTFFTNYLSKKGKQLSENKHGALQFFWQELERQIRIEGSIEKISNEISTQYFQSRPFGNQIGGLVSQQSSIVESREFLENKYDEIFALYENKIIPKPEEWGGYILKPNLFEFWQGRSNRLHDRIEYTITNDGNWSKNRLAP